MASEPDWSAVRSAVAAQSAERAVQLRRVMILQVCGWVVFGSICAVGVTVSYLRSEPGIVFATLFAAVIALTPFGLVVAAKQRRLQTDFYLATMPPILPALDQWSIFTRRPARQIARMPGHYFVPRDEIDCDFHVEGSLHGVPFSLTQAVLRHSPGDNPETSFRGLIVWTRVSNAFPGDFAALRRPPRQRSLWRGTALPERLIPIPNASHLGRWAYDFVTTDLDSACVRLPELVSAIDTLLTLKLEDLPQVAIRGSDAFVLLPFPRFGWNSERPVRDLDVDRDMRPFASMLVGVIEAIAVIRSV